MENCFCFFVCLLDWIGVIDKISNLKVNTKETDVLDELSTDLEIEMSALEEALSGVTR